ncbi:MAG TPA: nuclear transport factor 2 family protein [Mycobacteriales bacterium]
MYKAIVRSLIRKDVAALVAGDPGPAAARYADDAVLRFPGQNSWAMQHRDTPPSTEEFATHRGRAEIEAFLARYTAEGMKMHVDDILVNGFPWHTRAAVRVTHVAPDRTETRGVMFITSRWGKVVAQEDYEDTQAIAAREAGRTPSAAGGR